MNKITFYDNFAERQEIVARACEIYFRENAPEIEFSYTTDPETAFTGTDFRARPHPRGPLRPCARRTRRSR